MVPVVCSPSPQASLSPQYLFLKDPREGGAPGPATSMLSGTSSVARACNVSPKPRAERELTDLQLINLPAAQLSREAREGSFVKQNRPRLPLFFQNCATLH